MLSRTIGAKSCSVYIRVVFLLSSNLFEPPSRFVELSLLYSNMHLFPVTLIFTVAISILPALVSATDFKLSCDYRRAVCVLHLLSFGPLISFAVLRRRYSHIHRCLPRRCNTQKVVSNINRPEPMPNERRREFEVVSEVSLKSPLLLSTIEANKPSGKFHASTGECTLVKTKADSQIILACFDIRQRVGTPKLYQVLDLSKLFQFL